MRPMHYLMTAFCAFLIVAGVAFASYQSNESQLAPIGPPPPPSAVSGPVRPDPALILVPVTLQPLSKLVAKENIQDEKECRDGAAE